MSFIPELFLTFQMEKKSKKCRNCKKIVLSVLFSFLSDKIFSNESKFTDASKRSKYGCENILYKQQC